VASSRSFKHGLRKHPLYSVWDGMTQRCTNQKTKAYKNYGGRGVVICDEWRGNFKPFYDWCLSNGWRKGLEIDRIDNDGNYEPSNCRFISHRLNNLNTRMQENNTSGYVGVCFNKNKSKWVSAIKIHQKSKHLGYFEFKQQAVEARNNYIIENNLTEYKIQEWRNE